MPKTTIPPLLWSVPNTPPPVDMPSRHSPHYLFWLSKQEPLMLTESKRQYLLRDFVDIVASNAAPGWGPYNIKIPKSAFMCEDAPRVQTEYNRWLHSWDWSEPFYTYVNTIKEVLINCGSETWLIASVKNRIDLQFAVELSLIVGYATERITKAKTNRLLKKFEPFQVNYPNDDNGRTHAVADFIEHWMSKHPTQQGLVDYLQTWLSMQDNYPVQSIRPRPSFAPLKSSASTIEWTYAEIDIVFHGLIASSMHQEHLHAPKNSIILPAGFDLCSEI